MTTNPNVCSDTAYQNSILIKQRFQLNNKPPKRLDNLANNPYNIQNNNSTSEFTQAYTQEQLDMRRKAEILKYRASRTNTKTNNLTRAQLWAQLVNGSTQQRNLSQSFINTNTITSLSTATSIFVQTCPSGTIIHTPSYASGVPGPITNLYLDTNIPLYNYSTRQDAYAILNEPDTTEPFIFLNELDQFDGVLTLINNVAQNTVTLTSIFIQIIDTPTYSFIMEFPISMYIRGDILESNIGSTTIPDSYQTTIDISANTIQNKITPFSTTVKYAISELTNIEYDLIFNGIDSRVQFDISMNITDPMNKYFYGNQYLGTCKLQNFRITDSTGNTITSGLYTQKGYVYDIILSSIDKKEIPLITIDFPLNDTEIFFHYFNQPSYGLFINVSKNSANQFINCTASGNFPNINTLYSPLSVI